MSAKLPSAVVAVEKNFGREVLVGIVDSNRHITSGFTSDWPTTIHYRTLPHGAFSVLVGARHPVEVRVMLDGELLCEQFLDPLPSPRASTRSDVVRKAGELTNQPQPFFISFNDDGGQLKFGADTKGRSSDELLRLQLHPEPLLPASGPAVMHVGELPTGLFDAVVDRPPVPAGAQAAAGLAPLPVSGSMWEPSRNYEDKEPLPGSGGGAKATAEAPEPAPMVRAQVDAQGTVLPSDHQIQAPVPTAWAPSHGLVVIGVRMVQTMQEGEPTLPPDGFEYVLFQLNTWEMHARIRANLHSRIKLGPRVKYPELTDGHVHTDDGPCSCGHSHGFDPQRFR